MKGGLLWTLSSAAPAPGFVPAVVNVKLYLDVAVYFSALGGTVVLGLLALRWPALARALHLRLGAVLLPRALLAAHLDACSQADADHANEEREADAEVEDEAAAARAAGGGAGRAGGALAACCGARVRRSAAHWLGVPPTLAAAARRLLSVPREALATVRDLSVGETLVGAEVLALYAFWLWFWSTGYPRIRLEVASAPASALTRQAPRMRCTACRTAAPNRAAAHRRLSDCPSFPFSLLSPPGRTATATSTA